MSLLTQEAWTALIPHAGAMALIDVVVAWNATSIHATGERHSPDEHPLRDAAGLHAVHLIEYGAQAAAVHSALLGGVDVRDGRLVSLRDVQLTVDYVDLARGRLDVQAQQLVADQRVAQYAFQVEQHGRLLASGRLMVMYAVTS
ncbi:MAG TPA: phosphotransferase [Dyella sp.]|uniref:phosphotransferase n=1 Tax=Dyella sp. TaxID=1869338 RepID=UPI002C6C0220|nr:phosphotransferase [Dyella sp.]HUB89552.1 phosphotransferase [Dyella sp.]